MGPFGHLQDNLYPGWYPGGSVDFRAYQADNHRAKSADYLIGGSVQLPEDESHRWSLVSMRFAQIATRSKSFYTVLRKGLYGP